MQVRLPYTVLPDVAASVLANPHDGILVIRLTVDKAPPSQQADVGSKAWLLSRALDGGGVEERKAACEGGDGTRMNVGKTAQEKAAAAAAASAGVLPEDQFHLKLPKGAGAVFHESGYRCGYDYLRGTVKYLLLNLDSFVLFFAHQN